MTQESMNRANILNSAELKELLGPPPVLSSEKAKAYDEIWARLMESLGPGDFLEQLLIKQLIDDTWEAMRYVRHKSLAIERKARQLREFQAKRAKTLTQMKPEGNRPYPANELGRMHELEDKIEDTIADVDAILDKPMAELDHARALEKGVVYHLQLDQLLNAAMVRRDDALEQLDRYRRGSGKRLRKVSDEIIDVDFNDIAQESKNLATKDLAPPIVPSSDGGQ